MKTWNIKTKLFGKQCPMLQIINSNNESIWYLGSWKFLTNFKITLQIIEVIKYVNFQCLQQSPKKIAIPHLH